VLSIHQCECKIIFVVWDFKKEKDSSNIEILWSVLVTFVTFVVMTGFKIFKQIFRLMFEIINEVHNVNFFSVPQFLSVLLTRTFATKTLAQK
jgi:hypothetical protein